MKTEEKVIILNFDIKFIIFIHPSINKTVNGYEKIPKFMYSPNNVTLFNKMFP